MVSMLSLPGCRKFVSDSCPLAEIVRFGQESGLDLTVNGRTVRGCSAVFDPLSGDIPTLTLEGSKTGMDDFLFDLIVSLKSEGGNTVVSDVIPGSKTLMLPAKTAYAGDTGTFEGESSNKYCSFKYKGNISVSSLEIEIFGLRLMDAPIVGTSWKPAETGLSLIDLSELIGQIRFNRDGTMTVGYVSDGTEKILPAGLFDFVPLGKGNDSKIRVRPDLTVLSDLLSADTRAMDINAILSIASAYLADTFNDGLVVNCRIEGNFLDLGLEKDFVSRLARTASEILHTEGVRDTLGSTVVFVLDALVSAMEKPGQVDLGIRMERF